MRILFISGLEIILFSLFFKFYSFAQHPSASQIERTHQILKEEQTLQEKLQKEDKVFIKKIIIKGISLLTEDEIKKMILSFQKHWLSKTEAQQILEEIKQVYAQKGYKNQLLKISFKIKKNYLIIEVKEKIL
ncbi:MAG: hypothetical protein NC935_07355 [Candidatus Omnitrophica bacterium]|nr:hypothetical protein [Candidatus Omnitrophota bacterium]